MRTVPKTNKSDKSPAKAPEPKVAPPKVAETPSAPVAAPKAAQVTPVAAPVIPPATTPKPAQVAPLASMTPSAVDAVAAPVAVVTELAIASIRLDGGTQSRASLSTTTIAEYAEAMTAGATFPPVVVFDDGKARWLADGFHRVNASVKLGRERIACEVREGSQRDAILYSVAANATHGLRRTNADKRHAVELLLGDAKWSKKSDRWIADTCGVSHTFISKARDQLATVASSPREGNGKARDELSTAGFPQLAPTREGKDGKARKLPASKPTHAAVASPLTIAMAPTDEASALADLRADIERHLLAWTWSIDPLLAVLESSSERARTQFAKRKAV